MKQVLRFLALAALLAAPWGGYFNQVQAQQSLPYSYGFEDNNLATDGWTTQSIAGSTGINSSAKKTGSYGFQFYYNTNPPQYLISPELTGTENGVEVTFQYKNGSTWTETFTVGYSTTTGSVDQFTWDSPEYTAPTSWTEYQNTFPAGTKYVAIKYTANNQFKMYIDDISFMAPASCPKPTGVAASNVTTTGATLTWTKGGSETAWVLEYSTASDFTGANSVNTGFTVSGSTVTANLTGLTAETPYYVRVKAVCDGDDVSDWTTSYSFTTACNAVTSFPWSEDFESLASGNFAANCWVNEHISGSGSSIFKVYTSTNGTNSTHQLQLPDMSSGTLTKLVLPVMTLPGTNYLFSIDVYRVNATYYPGEGVRVYASTDGEIEGATELAFISRNYSTSDDGLIPAETAAGWYTYELPIGIGGTCYIILRGESQYGSATYMDNLKVSEIPSCLKPTDVTCTATTTTSATLSWTAGGTETDWTVEYGTAADFTGAASQNVSTTPTLALTGLTPATTYYVRVKAVCSGSDESDWSTAATFTTECAAIAALGYTQNFDGISIASAYTPTSRTLPICWSSINTCTYNDYKYYPTIYYYSYTNYSNSTPNCLRFYSYYSSYTDYDPQPQYAILPEMTGLAGKQVTLSAKGSNASSTFKIGTMSDPADASTFTLITEQPLTTSYQEFEYLVPTTTDAYLAIMIDAADASRNTNGVYIDDISIAEPPTCPKPTSLMLETPSSRTAHTATLTWTNGDAETAWQIVYSTESTFDPAGATPVDVTTKPYTLTGLNASTTYYAYVRANCGGGDESAWCTTKASFTTTNGIGTPTGLAVDNATLAHNTATVTWSRVATNDLHESFDIYFSTDGTAPTAETVPTYTGITAMTYTFTGLTEATTYYVWVRDVCGTDGNSAWSSRLSFTTTVFCPAPTGVAVSSATAHGATISWTGTSDSYNVYVGKATVHATTYDFEDNAISADFTNDATNAWTVTTSDKHAGTYSIKSAGGFSYTQSDLTLTVNLTEAATITFWDKASSEGGYDYGRFLIDGEQKHQTSGTTNSWTERTYELTAGSHTLVWRYYKDYSGDEGNDCYYVDDITIQNVEVASWESYEAPASPYVLNDESAIDPETDYAVKVVGVCESTESHYESATVRFTTSADCGASNAAVSNVSFHGADVTWDGSSDAGYTVSYRTAAHFAGINEEFATSSLPTGWENKSGLLSSVMGGTALTSGSGWSTTSYALGTYNVKANIYGTSSNKWLITPATLLPAGVALDFDMALTDYNNSDPIEDNTAQADDRFVVLISTDNMASWTILREWNNSGSIYVYNNIATAGEHVTIDLSAYAATNVRIAFYGESTETGGDNDLHIDNVVFGTPVAAGAWQSVVAPSSPVTIEDLEDGTAYEVKVSPICDPSIETNAADFTTVALPTFNVTANNWYALSSPMHDAGQTYESVANVENLTTGTYDFLRYDEPTSTWESQKNGGFSTLEPGRGYIYRRANDAVLKVDGEPNTGNVNVDITKDVDGWNLIGNPFMVPIRLNSTYMAPSSTAVLTSGGYKLSTNGTWTAIDTYTDIVAGQAVLVKATTAGTLTLRPSASKSVSAAEEESNKGIVFSVSNDVFTDVAIVRFSSEEGLPKISHLNPEAPMLSIDGYAIANLNEGIESFPMSFSGQGSYTLTVSGNTDVTGYLHLVDRLTGRDIDLLSTPSYSFTGSPVSDRFTVKLTPDANEGNSTTRFAIFDGNSLIVNGEGTLEVYDVMGRRLMSAEVTGSEYRIPGSDLHTGVYVLRLNGNSQKIVIK